jgi:hypothetical protein
MENAMFLAVVSRPMKRNPTPESLAFRQVDQDPDDWYYTGKIGMKPIVEEWLADFKKDDTINTMVAVAIEVFKSLF